MKNVSIIITQDSDGRYRVASFVNTTQISIGETVDRERVERWLSLPGVTVRCAGLTSDSAESAQPDLIGDVETAPAPKNAPSVKPVRRNSKPTTLALAK